MQTGMYDSLAEVRTALSTSTNTTGGDTRTALGGNEIQKMIERKIVDALNRGTDFRRFVRRVQHDQLGYIWNLRIDLGSTSKAAFYSEGASGTPYPSQKVQLYAACKSYRADYEVSGLMIAGSRSYYNAIEDEMSDALDALKILEEKAMLCGSDTSAYGLANAFDGLLQLMGSYTTFGDTDTVYGIARASGKTYLDVGLVAAGATATAPFSLKLLDSAITVSEKADGNDGNDGSKIFLCSKERVDEISQLLQSQQRFPLKVVEGRFGFRVLNYRGLDIIGSRFMDKNGITWDGATKTKSYADNSMYLLAMDYIIHVILDGVDFVHVPIMGADASQRSDVRGGFFKTYGVFVMKRFDNQVLIYNLDAP